jgi:hypothetical protein
VRRWRWAFSRFWPSKTEIFVHLGRETPQKRLRNGWRNGRFSAKVTAIGSHRCDQRSWGVALPSDQAGIEEVEPWSCQGAHRAVSPDALTYFFFFF